MKPVRLLLIAPVIACLLALCVLSLAWTGRADPVLALAGNNSLLVHPARDMRRLVRGLQEGGAELEPTALRDAIALLGQAPLEDEPFTLAAFAMYRQERYEKASALVEIARKRNPRSREARLLSVDITLANGEVGAAVADLEALLELLPGQRRLIEETLVLLASHPQTGAHTLAAVKGERNKVMIIGGLARSGASASEVQSAIEGMRAGTALRGDRAALAAVIRTFVDRANYGEAYQIWSGLMKDLAPASDALRDPQFDQILPPPFGWELLAGTGGYASLVPDGLAGEAYGRSSASLARQLLLLSPGTHRITIDVAEADDLFEITLRCVSNEEIAKTRLGRTGEQKLSFSVPQDCPAQWIDIRARASDPPRTGAFRLQSITLSKGGQ